MQSAFYRGKVYHARHLPKRHVFDYRIVLWWLDLDEIEDPACCLPGISTRQWRPLQFRRSDYLGDPDTKLKSAVLTRMSELAGQPLTGKVFFLGQIRMFGLYFSPVNFYYLQAADGQFTHLLAEVSNTPWNERHHYLVDLNAPQDTDKAFHVSPFNPMNMQYKWHVPQPGDVLSLSMGCFSGTRHFDAGIHLRKQKLNSKTLFRVMLSIPGMTIKTVVGIYWQALKLFIKGVPVHDHPGRQKG